VERKAAPSLISIAAFVKRHAPTKRTAPRERLLPWINWYWRSGLCGVLREHGKIVAVALVRCVESIEQARMPYAHDERGRIVWVDDIVSRHPQGIAFLLDMCRERFGPREAFAGEVFVRDGELRMLPWKIVERLAAAMKHEHKPTSATGGA
jgi:hypothetical protein